MGDADVGSESLQPRRMQVETTDPIASPPGMATSASPIRATSGPSTEIEARKARTSS